MPTEAKAVPRVGMYLMRRGFDADVVRSSLRAAAADVPAGEEVGRESDGTQDEQDRGRIVIG